MPHEVFISYSSHRLDTAEEICGALEAVGITCWMAPRNIPPSSNYGGEITGAIEQCKLVLLVFCEHANTSHYVMRELEMAVHYKRPVLPIRLESVEVGRELRFYLASCQWLDATKPPFEYHLNRIIEAVRHILAPAPALVPDPGPGLARSSVPTPLASASQKRGKAPLLISAVAAAIAIILAIVFWPKPSTSDAYTPPREGTEAAAPAPAPSPAPSEASTPLTESERAADRTAIDLFTRPAAEKSP